MKIEEIGISLLGNNAIRRATIFASFSDTRRDYFLNIAATSIIEQ